MPAHFIDLVRFCEENGLVVGDVRRWINEGRLPAVKLGRTILLPEDALERALSEATSGSAPNEESR